MLLRLTPGQRDLVDQAAEHAGLSRSGWMRAALLRGGTAGVGRGAAPWIGNDSGRYGRSGRILPSAGVVGCCCPRRTAW